MVYADTEKPEIIDRELSITKGFVSMSYNASTRTSGAGQAIAGVFAAGVMFILGYTVVRVSLAERSLAPAVESSDAEIQMAIPGEGTLWAEFGNSY